MTVVRYTFDVCIRTGANKDEYDISRDIEKAIMGCNNVCGCETFLGDQKGYSSVDVSDAIKWQRTNKCWLGEKGGAL